MSENELREEYFNWLYRLVCDDLYTGGRSYYNLLFCLHSRDFIVLMDRDENRAEDGVDLRYRFGYENSIDGVPISAFLDCFPCSILEMMVALASRCEEMMRDPDLGNRTGKWFWDMVINLGLYDMDDDAFDEDFVNYILDRFLNREYDRDGRGGLFTIKNSKRDLRYVEIWYQMGWHLNDLIEKGE